MDRNLALEFVRITGMQRWQVPGTRVVAMKGR